MQTEFKAVVVLPDNYSENMDQFWPVVYLLHGWSGKYSNWANKTDLNILADKYELWKQMIETNDMTKKDIFSYIGIRRNCCKKMIITHVNLYNEINDHS